MKKFSTFTAFIVLLSLPLLLVLPVYATSQQAYQDYLYQFDLYRQKYSDFQVAKNSFEKFKTLESQTQALSATKFMLSQRDLLLHAYLLYIYERVGEQPGLTSVNRQLYRSLLSNELSFLETQSGLVSSINSIDDATTTSQELENHYQILQATVRNIIAGIALGQLNVIAQNFDYQVQAAQLLTNQNVTRITTQKRTVVTNGLLQIANKRNLYQQKIDQISASVEDLTTSNDAGDLDQKYADVLTKIGEAKQYLADGIATLLEITVTLQYTD